MDQWANPLVVSALMSTRDGIFDMDAVTGSVRPDPAPPAYGTAGVLKRWDPWVRLNLGVTEATRGITYATVGTDGYKVTAGGADLVVLTRPDLPFFQAQLAWVQSWADLRDERAYEALAQIDNQFAFIAAVTGLHVERHKWTMEWLMTAIQFTIAVELMFKHTFACRRPVDLSAQIQPIVSTPGHGSYPMGHAAQAFATAVALRGLLGLGPTHPASVQLMRQARRISINRVVAGVHFPVDAAAGELLGTTLGEYFLGLSGVAGVSCLSRTFVPTGAGSLSGNDYVGDIDQPILGAQVGPVVVPPTSAFLSEVRLLAQAEWTA